MPFRARGRTSSMAPRTSSCATTRWMPQTISMQVYRHRSGKINSAPRREARFEKIARLFSGTMKDCRQSLGTTVSSGVPSANARVGILADKHGKQPCGAGSMPVVPCHTGPCPANSNLLDPNANVCVDNNVANYLPFFEHLPTQNISGDVGRYVFARQQVVSENYFTIRGRLRKFRERTASLARMCTTIPP